MLKHQRSSGLSVVQSLAIVGITALSISTSVLAATPNPQPGCPDGWVPRPPDLNPALGPCVPGSIQQPGGGTEPVKKALPDLKIQQVQFPANANQAVRVQVANTGNATAAPSVLRLTVRRINGTPVGRTMEVQLPSIQKNQAKSMAVNAKGILPLNVALKDTTFRLNLDITEIVSESDESNNETWHNL
jgi:hypothetical protein